MLYVSGAAQVAQCLALIALRGSLVLVAEGNLLEPSSLVSSNALSLLLSRRF